MYQCVLSEDILLPICSSVVVVLRLSGFLRVFWDCLGLYIFWYIPVLDNHMVSEKIIKKLQSDYNKNMKFGLTVSKCVLWCFALSELFEKLLGQLGNWQRYGLSPVWLLWWIFKFSSLENALEHPLNWNNTIGSTRDSLFGCLYWIW